MRFSEVVILFVLYIIPCGYYLIEIIVTLRQHRKNEIRFQKEVTDEDVWKYIAGYSPDYPKGKHDEDYERKRTVQVDSDDSFFG